MLTQLPGVCLLFYTNYRRKYANFFQTSANWQITLTILQLAPFPSSPQVTTMSELVEIDEALLDTDLEYRYQYLCQFMGFTDKDVQLIHGTISHPSWPSWLPL